MLNGTTYPDIERQASHGPFFHNFRFVKFPEDLHFRFLYLLLAICFHDRFQSEQNGFAEGFLPHFGLELDVLIVLLLPFFAVVHEEKQLLEYLLLSKAISDRSQLFFLDTLLECFQDPPCDFQRSKPVCSDTCRSFPPAVLLCPCPIAPQPRPKSPPQKGLTQELLPVGFV